MTGSASAKRPLTGSASAKRPLAGSEGEWWQLGSAAGQSERQRRAVERQAKQLHVPEFAQDVPLAPLPTSSLRPSGGARLAAFSADFRDWKITKAAPEAMMTCTDLFRAPPPFCDGGLSSGDSSDTTSGPHAAAQLSSFATSVSWVAPVNHTLRPPLVSSRQTVQGEQFKANSPRRTAQGEQYYAP